MPLPTLCLVSEYSSFLVKIPTQAPRTTITTLRASSHGASSTWHWTTTISSEATSKCGGARVTAINVTDKYALYNFLSTFSGKHDVTPWA